MIPDWKAALANARRLLKPGGHLCICDFTVHASQWPVSRYFWKRLFASDQCVHHPSPFPPHTTSVARCRREHVQQQ